MAKVAATFEKPNQQIHFHLCGNGWLFMWCAYFCMGAYKYDVVVVINGCLSAYYPYFTEI